MNYRLPEEWEPYITTTPYVNESGIFSYAEGELIKGPFGTLLKRCSEENGYRLWLHELEVNQPFQFQLSFPKPTASIMYMLEGEMVYPDEEMPHVLATSGFYYLSYMPVLNLPVIVQAGRHTLLQLDLSEKLLEVVGLKYYGTFEIWNSLQQDSLDGYIRDVCPITEPVRNLLHQLLHCDMEEEERMLHHYARFIDLLLLYFKHLETEHLVKTPGGYRFTQEDRAAVIAAGKLQLENMDTFLSLEEMASSVLLHPKKLNEGFKLMHGMSSQEWVLEQKLQRGLELLKTTDQTLLQIGLEIGYGSLSSFSKAFKKRFNVTPSSVRK